MVRVSYEGYVVYSRTCDRQWSKILSSLRSSRFILPRNLGTYLPCLLFTVRAPQTRRLGHPPSTTLRPSRHRRRRTNSVYVIGTPKRRTDIPGSYDGCNYPKPRDAVAFWTVPYLPRAGCRRSSAHIYRINSFIPFLKQLPLTRTLIVRPSIDPPSGRLLTFTLSSVTSSTSRALEII